MTIEPPQLSRVDRLRGYQNLRLIGNWESWVIRRVEAIEYETAAAIRRHVSVDMRLREDLFSDPMWRWGEIEIHYVPLALLNKRPLHRFDVRDESGTALPVMSRQKNSVIASATLVALAQSLIISRARLEGEPPADLTASRVIVPRSLEETFWRLAYFNWTEEGGDDDASSVYDSLFVSPVGEPIPVGEWRWNSEDDGFRADVPDDLWRSTLLRDRQFANLANDFGRLFLVSVPLRFDPGRRRIIKFGYTQHLTSPESEIAGRIKRTAARIGLARGWNTVEDWLERLPAATKDDMAVPEYQESDRPDPQPVPMRDKALRWLGWASTAVPLDTPAIGHGASYHLDVVAPAGIQIRRAQLIVKRPLGPAPFLRARVGVRTLRTVHLYVTRAGQDASGQAVVYFRPESSFIVRGAALASTLTASVLTLLYAYASRIEHGNAEAAATALVIIPGLISAYAARAEEHPLATQLAVGVRTVAIVPGVLALAGAGLIVINAETSVAALVLFIAAWVVTGILVVGWRLAGRGRPHPTALKDD